MTELSNDSRPLEWVGVECDLIVIGLLAIQYARMGPKPISRGFASELTNHQVYDPIRALWFAVSHQRRDGVSGAIVVAREQQGGSPVWSQFYPYDSLSTVRFEAKGVED